MKSSIFAVAGVSGHTGSSTANALLAKGAKVRVIVRNLEKAAAWKARGCEVAVADLSDVGALSRALDGVNGAYLLSPPNMGASDFIADRTVVIENMAKAVTEAKVPHVVFLSSVGAQHASGTGPIVTAYRAEKAFQNAAPSVTFIRASYFLENWGSMVSLAKAQGILPHYGDVNLKFSQVSSSDIGTLAATSLLEPKLGVNTIELAGVEDWSVNDVAKELGLILNRPVTAVSAPLEQAQAGLAQAGLPNEMARLYAELYRGLATGLVAAEKLPLVRGTHSLNQALKALV